MKQTICKEIRTIDTIKKEDKELYQKIIKKHYDINLDDQWWEYLIDDFIIEELQNKYGLTFDVNKLEFDLLYYSLNIKSLEIEDYQKLKDYLKRTGDYYNLYNPYLKIIRDDNDTLSWSYEEIKDEAEIYMIDDIKYILKEGIIRSFEIEDDLTNIINELWKDINKKLLKIIYDSYLELQDEEIIYDTLLCNEYFFDEDGDII